MTTGLEWSQQRARAQSSVSGVDAAPDYEHLDASVEIGHFGNLIGVSPTMRRLFALMDRVALSDATILLLGETGTGKGAVAQAIHAASPRAHRQFVVVDCGAIPGSLLEDELFGHERGAYTGADSKRTGAFERANGGTIFLDEVGELPQELQPKLLGVLENRTIRRLGSGEQHAVDVRVIAATNRDLAAAVRIGQFRSDLYFRLAVVPVEIPPLRSRPEDVVVIARHLLGALGLSEAEAVRLLRPEYLCELQKAFWPGNVRELRNHLERAVVLSGGAVPLTAVAIDPVHSQSTVESTMLAPYAVARQQALHAFERSYVKNLLRLYNGCIAQAAAACGLSREYLYRLVRRHGVASDP